MKAGKIANIFLAGAIVGSAAAIFMTPFSGKKMRKETKKKADGIWGKTKQEFSKRKQEMKPHLEKLQKNTKDVRDKVEKSFKEKGKSFLDKVKERKNKEVVDKSEQQQGDDKTTEQYGANAERENEQDGTPTSGSFSTASGR